MSNIKAIEAMICLCIIDDTFHENEKAYLADICEEEFELPKSFIEEKHQTLKEKNISELAGIFNQFVKSVKKNEREYYYKLFFDLAKIDSFLHPEEIKLLINLEKIWDLKIAASPVIIPSNEQKEIIESDSRSKLKVISPPGCGKTAVAAQRCVFLVKQHQINPSNLLVLSFSRAAIKELRDRIEIASDVDTFPIKLSTIDQHTFKFLRGWGQEEVKDYLKDYEQNIEAFNDLIEKKNEDVIADIKNFKHVIIDEAQDITGIRSTLLQNIIKNLDKDCGVTIFSDPMQAIYNFTLEEGYQNEKQENFLDTLSNKIFSEKKLSKIYRTDSKQLSDMFMKYRLNFIEADDDPDGKLDYLEKKKTLFKEAKEKSNGMDDDLVKSIGHKHLFLFRKKSEMLKAAEKAFEKKKNVSLRFGGSPDCIYPWIARIFHDHMEPTISKKSFIDKWRNKLNIVSNLQAEEAWEKIFKEAPMNVDVSVEMLREKLSSGRPSLDLCMKDYGESSNVLGTIHASKGREAETVFYYTFKDKEPSQNTDFHEETRVMYVAMTRCRNKFGVRDLEEEIGFKDWAKRLNNKSNRIYAKRTSRAGNPYFLVQVGLKDDIDEIRLVARPAEDEFGFEEKERVDKSQNFFSSITSPVEVGMLHYVIPKQKNYSMFFGKKKITDEKYNTFVLSDTYGYMGENFTIELQGIINKEAQGRTTKLIDNVYLIGSRTCVVGKNHMRLPSIHDPYGKTGFWLAPLIAGWASVRTKKKSRYRRGR